MTVQDARRGAVAGPASLARQPPEARPVRPDVGDVLEERNEARLEGRLLGADGGAPAAQPRDRRRGLRRVFHRDGAGPEPREEALALAEDRRLRDDLGDLLERHASRRREDEAHRDLHLGEDHDRAPAVDDRPEGRRAPRPPGR